MPEDGCGLCIWGILRLTEWTFDQTSHMGLLKQGSIAIEIRSQTRQILLYDPQLKSQMFTNGSQPFLGQTFEERLNKISKPFHKAQKYSCLRHGLKVLVTACGWCLSCAFSCCNLVKWICHASSATARGVRRVEGPWDLKLGCHGSFPGQTAALWYTNADVHYGERRAVGLEVNFYKLWTFYHPMTNQW